MAAPSRTASVGDGLDGLKRVGLPASAHQRPDPLPRALLARFGRTAAVHVVEHVEERLAAARAPGIEGRVAGRELRPGMEREMALSFLSQLGSASGVHPVGMGSHGPMAGSRAGGMGSLGTPGRAAGTPMAAAGGSMMGVVSGLGATAGPLGGAFGPDGGLNGGGLLQMGLGGADVLTGSDVAPTRETRHGGILSFWSRGARSSFAGREGALSLGGDVRTTMAGADYAKGPLVAGLSLSHSRGPAGRLAATDAAVTRFRTGLEGARTYTLAGRLSLTPSVEVGLRHDGGEKRVDVCRREEIARCPCQKPHPHGSGSRSRVPMTGDPCPARASRVCSRWGLAHFGRSSGRRVGVHGHPKATVRSGRQAAWRW